MPIARPKKRPLSVDKKLMSFSRGLQSDASTYTIQDDEWQVGTWNMRAKPMGQVIGRLGQTLVSPAGGLTGVGAVAPWVNTIYRFYRQDDNHSFLFWVEDELWAVDDLTDVNTDKVKVLVQAEGTPPSIPTHGTWRMVTIPHGNNWVYMVNSARSELWRTDGATMWPVAEPMAWVPTTADGGAGGNVAAGDYYHAFTWVLKDNLGELPAKVIGPVTVAAPASDIDIANLPITGTLPAGRADVVAVRIYRTVVGGSSGGPFYFVAESNLSSATYVDQRADAELTSRLADLVTPPNSAVIEYHDGRVFLGYTLDSKVEVMAGEAIWPEEFQGLIRYRASTSTGEPVTGLKSGEDYLVITTANQYFLLVGTGVLSGPGGIPDYRVVKVAGGRGSPGNYTQECLRGLRGAIYSFNGSGVWRFDGQAIKNVAENRVLKFMLDNVNRASAHLSTGVATDTEYRVSFPVIENSLHAYTLIYDVVADAFMVDRGYRMFGYVFLDGETDSGELIGVGDFETDTSHIYKMDTGALGDFNPATSLYVDIDWDLKLKNFVMGDLNDRWQGRFAVFGFGRSSGTSPVSLYMTLNDKAEFSLPPLFITVGGGTVGGITWNNFVWDGGRVWNEEEETTPGVQTRQQTVSLIQAVQAERIGVRFSQSGLTGPFELEMLHLVGEGRGIRGVATQSDPGQSGGGAT